MAIKTKIVLFLLSLSIFVLGLYLWNSLAPSLRGSVVTYTNNQQKSAVGKIVALPGEAMRFNLQNNGIYIKRGNHAFRLRENYLPSSSAAYSLSFIDGWYFLKNDQVLVLKDDRTIRTMDDFIYYEDNVIKQNQITGIQKSAKRSDVNLEPVDETKEFAIHIEKPWMAWQTQTSDRINLKNGATPIVRGGVVYLPTWNNHLIALDAGSGRKLWEATSLEAMPHIEANIGSSENFLPVENLPLVVQQSPFRNSKYFPKYFQKSGDYLAGLGSFGGNYLEDVPYRSSVYVFDAKTGRLLFTKSNLGYANFAIFGNNLLIFDKILEGYNLSTGLLSWSNTISGDVGTTGKPWVADDDKQTIFAADKTKIAALSVQDGHKIWEKSLTSSLQTLFIKNGNLYFEDKGNSGLYALDKATGSTLWYIKYSDPTRTAHITDTDEVYFRDLQNVNLQFTQTNFYALSPKTHEPIKIFSHITKAENDIVFEYGEPYIFVFADDFVTAVKYFPKS